MLMKNLQPLGTAAEIQVSESDTKWPGKTILLAVGSHYSIKVEEPVITND